MKAAPETHRREGRNMELPHSSETGFYSLDEQASSLGVCPRRWSGQEQINGLADQFTITGSRNVAKPSKEKYLQVHYSVNFL